MSVQQQKEEEILESPKLYIKNYLRSRSATYRELVRVQDEGWLKKEGDDHFQKQQDTADNADWRTAQAFFRLMQKIGNEMHNATGVMNLDGSRKILDLCMAPGGYSASALRFNPGASVSGVTLPEGRGGHKLLLRKSVRVWQGDLTLLVGDMGMGDDSSIPDTHSDYGRFHKDEIWPVESFDLVFCDGQVLRNHSRKMVESRQTREARRLTCGQLLIAMRHVKVGGSMVVLLHKIDAWHTLSTIRTFDRFASVKLFKPLAGHRSRNSFYLVAQDIQPDHHDALQAVQEWTQSWKDATFPNLADEAAISGQGSTDAAFQEQVVEAMDDFGERLISLAETPWRIQKEAIENSWWFKGSTVEN